MIVDHFRKDFMEVIVGHRVILIAHQDVDSACAVKILTSLFKTEGITYVLLSVDSVTSLRAKYEEYSGQSKIFVLVNCGASIDLLETLDKPPADTVFFLLDHHRPIHIMNYYNSTGQIKLVSGPEPEEQIPEFDKVFADVVSDDSDVDAEMKEDEEEGDEGEDGLTGRLRRRAERVERRRTYHKWKGDRERILFKYRENSYFARPSALYALEIAWVMSRDDMESIWCAIVALTDALVMGRLARSKYTEFASTVNDHILRITNAEKLPRDCLKVRFERELFLFLYRSWSVYESVKATPYTACRLKTWSVEGTRRFHQLLAYLGLPLVEVRQSFTNMSLDLRRQLVDMFSSDTAVERYKLPGAVFGSFVAEIGFRQKFNALDVQLAVLAVLEDPDASRTSEVKFINAMRLLDSRDGDSFKEGVVKAKSMLKLLQSQVQMMVDMKQVMEVGPFLAVQLSECLAEFNFFKRPTAIPLLAHYLQHAGIRSGKRKWSQAPWLFMIPYSSEYFIVVGIQPSAFEHPDNNIFKEVFRVMEVKMPDDILSDNFEGVTMLVKIAKRQAFLDQLLYITE